MDAGQRADVLAMWQVLAEPLTPLMAQGAGKGPPLTAVSTLRQLARAPMSLGDLLQGWALRATAGKAGPPSKPGGLTPFEQAQLRKGVPLEKIRRMTGRA